ncbi:hypothetical protein EBR57_01125 [bacterium]|nr:hypothetical protein [bacterium]
MEPKIMIVRSGNFSRILPQIGMNTGVMRRFSGGTPGHTMDITKRFNTAVAQVRRVPNEFEGAGFLRPPLGSGFLNRSRVDEFFAALRDARIEISRLIPDNLDLKLNTRYVQTHIFEEGPDVDGRTTYGIMKIALKINAVDQEPNAELFLKLMPRTADGARYGVSDHDECWLDPKIMGDRRLEIV